MKINGYLKGKLQELVDQGQLEQEEADKIWRYHAFYGEHSIVFADGIMQQIGYRVAGKEWIDDYEGVSP